jgi:ABC-2 type transport system permease protein
MALAVHGERARRVTGAFVWLGVTESVAYPLMLLLSSVVGPATLPILYRFISQLVDSGPEVGFDYYTFAVLGFATTAALNGGLTAFSGAVTRAIQQGRFETFLVQPISWYSLPFALAAWPIMLNLLNASVMMLVGLALGARVGFAQVPVALMLLFLGVAAAHAVGTIAASVKILSKRADPVVLVYNMAATVFSGALFPVSLLPWFLKPISYLLPHTYVLAGLRRILMEQGDAIEAPSVGVSILVLVCSTAFLYGVGLFTFGRALELGRRYGIIGGY